MISILGLPTEILWDIASSLKCDETSAFARANRTLYLKLRPALIRYNIKYHNSSALHWASKTDEVDFAKILISYGAAVNAEIDGYSPLMLAAVFGSERVLVLLLRDMNIKVNKVSNSGKSALWYGVAGKSCNVVNRLLEHPGVEIDIANREGQTALWLAVFLANGDMVKTLTSKGANPELKARDGVSPWIQSCIRNRNGIKELFLDLLQSNSLTN